MKCTVESLSPTKVKLVIDIGFEDLKPSLDATYQAIGNQIVVPGFRRGKVPPQVIDQRVGRGTVLEEAINDALPRLYGQAIQDNSVKAVGRPEIEISQINDPDNVVFNAEVEVRPEFTLPDTDGLRAEVPDLEVTDEAVAAQVSLLRERFGSLNTVERAAAEGDQVTIDLAANRDGEPIEAAQASGLTYEVGSGTMLDGLDAAVTGLKAGERASFTSQLLGGEYAGQDVDVEVRVEAVKEQELPEFDDEFAQTASEFDTVDELNADLRERIERRERLAQAAAARDAVLDNLLALAEIEIPEALLADELDARQHSIDEQLNEAGVSIDEFLAAEDLTGEEFEAQTKQRAEKAIRSQFALDMVAEQQQLTVQDEELTQYLVRRAQAAGLPPEQYAQQAMRQDLVPSLLAEIIRAKALAFLVENATVTDASGRPVELKSLRPDGSYADPEVADLSDTPADTTDDTAGATQRQ